MEITNQEGIYHSIERAKKSSWSTSGFASVEDNQNLAAYRRAEFHLNYTGGVYNSNDMAIYLAYNYEKTKRLYFK